jgi:hypothetical protein
MDNRPEERIETGRREARDLPGEPGEIRERETLRETPTAADRAARERSIGSLFKELRDETTTLMRQELALAKTEMSEKAKVYGRNAAAIGAGSAVLFAGVIVLLLAASAALYVGIVYVTGSHYLAGWLSPLIVGGLAALIGYAVMQKGITTIKHESPVPQKTVDTLNEDKQWLKSKTE